MKTFCLSGSASRPSHTLALVSHVGGLLEARGHELEVWHLAQRPVPFADPAHYGSDALHPGAVVRALIQAVAAADAVVLGTPNHHATFSGVLKNALDHLPAGAFERKPVGLLANGGGIRGSAVPCEHLRSVVKSLGGWATPTQVATCDGDFTEDDNGYLLVDPAVRRRCEGLVDDLCLLAAAVSRWPV